MRKWQSCTSWRIELNISCFSERFFCIEQHECASRVVFHVFLASLIFFHTDYFAKVIAFAKWAFLPLFKMFFFFFSAAAMSRKEPLSSPLGLDPCTRLDPAII